MEGSWWLVKNLEDDILSPMSRVSVAIANVSITLATATFAGKYQNLLDHILSVLDKCDPGCISWKKDRESALIITYTIHIPSQKIHLGQNLQWKRKIIQILVTTASYNGAIILWNLISFGRSLLFSDDNRSWTWSPKGCWHQFGYHQVRIRTELHFMIMCP